MTDRHKYAPIRFRPAAPMICQRCGETVTRNSSQQKFCPPCARERELERDREYQCRRRAAGDWGAYQRAWRAANPDREQERRRRYTDASPERYLLQRARSRAKADGIAFTIGLDDVVIPDFCPILDIPLARGNGSRAAPSSPTIDRIIPALGYVPGNVQVISHRANSMKRDGSLEELVKLGEWATARLEHTGGTDG